MLPVQEPLGEEEGFIHEIKWDGFRALAYLQGGKVLLESRGGHSLNRRFPQIASFLGQKEWQAVLDGEIVAFRPGGEADFSLLKSGSARMICYVAFDLLFLAGENLCPQPWQRRRALLEELVESAGPLLLSPLLPGSLGENLRRAREHGWEGIISKHRQSPISLGNARPGGASTRSCALWTRWWWGCGSGVGRCVLWLWDSFAQMTGWFIWAAAAADSVCGSGSSWSKPQSSCTRTVPRWIILPLLMVLGFGFSPI